MKNLLLWSQDFLQNVKISHGSENMTASIFGGLDFYIGNIGVTFSLFLPMISVTKMQAIGRISTKIIKFWVRSNKF